MNQLTAANGTNGTVGVATTVPGGGLVGSSPLSGIASLNFGIGTAKNGTEISTVFLQDNGGTLNGGVDTSAVKTISITVAPVNQAPSFTSIPGVVTPGVT